MKATKKTVENLKKEAETVSFLDRRAFNWFVNNETNELRIGKDFSDFLKGKTENFEFKKLHSGDVRYWKLAETADGKFILLSRGKLLK